MVKVEETYGGPPFLTTEHRCGPQREATLHLVTFHYKIYQNNDKVILLKNMFIPL